MLYKPTEFKTDSFQQKSLQSTLYRNQHGRLSILLAFPSESLTHITCFLDPPSLLSLARTNKHLNQHVGDDNTWHRAFVYQFLGIAPEGDLHNANTLMLRRGESSWRKEFVFRYNLRRCASNLTVITEYSPIYRRWERSHNSTVTHTPHHSVVNDMHLMPDAGLLTSSIQYGIVSRSLALTGKVLRGYLDASGTGLGIGNPNAEFTPNVSACALSSEGGTAKIIWGFRNGEVAVMSANRAMDNGRAAAKLTRCKVDEEHEGAVQDIAWDSGANAFVSGAFDGRVKLWDAKRVKCLWTSDRKEGSLVADPCIKVGAILARGVIVGVMKSGEMVVWTGLQGMLSDDSTPSSKPVVRETRIPSPVHPTSGSDAGQRHEIRSLYVNADCDDLAHILTTYENHPFFYRMRIALSSSNIELTQFGEESFGPINTTTPSFSKTRGESSFIIVGDQLGCISIYDWEADPSRVYGPSASVRALRKFEAHEDGGVTSIACNAIVLVTGSSRGTIKVWDSLTLAPLRSFPSPGFRPRAGGEWEGVGKIVLEKDLLLVNVGSRVMAWKAGPVTGRGPGALKGKSAKRGKKGALAKGYREFQALLLSRNIEY